MAEYFIIYNSYGMARGKPKEDRRLNCENFPIRKLPNYNSLRETINDYKYKQRSHLINGILNYIFKYHIY